MIQRLYAALGISLLATTFVVAQAGRTVQVDVNYTGSGTVDGSHKIYVALWDSADFSGGPAARRRASTASASARLSVRIAVGVR